MPTSAVGSKRCAVSSSTSRVHAATRDSPGSRWPAGWLSTSRPSIRSSTKRKRPSRSMTAATVTDGFHTMSGGLAGIGADEVGHARHALLDRLLRRSVGEAHVLALARHARAEMDVGQHRDAGFRQQALPELLGVGGADAAAGLGNVRPGVESAVRYEARHSRYFIQESCNEIPSFGEALLHHLRRVLRPGHRL